MKLFIKNMLTLSSNSRVAAIIESQGLHPLTVDTGEVEIEETLTSTEYEQLKKALIQEDFELIMDKDTLFAEKIKYLVIEMIHYSDIVPGLNYSEYISNQLQVNYTYLSRCFSKIRHITIEHFIIAHKIERVKQLLLQNEMTLSQIAWKLHYSSTAHLSAQFKKVTGITPSLFKKLKFKNLIPIFDL
jgi:AraC-like DNA-binding protein